MHKIYAKRFNGNFFVGFRARESVNEIGLAPNTDCTQLLNTSQHVGSLPLAKYANYTTRNTIGRYIIIMSVWTVHVYTFTGIIIIMYCYNMTGLPYLKLSTFVLRMHPEVFNEASILWSKVCHTLYRIMHNVCNTQVKGQS